MAAMTPATTSISKIETGRFQVYSNEINIQEFRDLIYEEVKRLHIIRYPYNNLLY